MLKCKIATNRTPCRNYLKYRNRKIEKYIFTINTATAKLGILHRVYLFTVYKVASSAMFDDFIALQYLYAYEFDLSATVL